MATIGPPPPGSVSASMPQPQPIPANPDQITWDGDKMFNIYILDYCKKRGYHKTANQLVAEADIPPESKPPINAQQGLLFEWWSVFWVLFQAKNSGNGTEDALLYHKYQNQQRQRSNQVPGVPQPPGRYSLPNGLTGPPLPNPQVNGIGPTGQPPLTLGASPYGPANPAAQPNGIPAPPAPPGPGQPFPGGIAGRPPLAPQQRIPNGPQYHSPTIAPSPQSHHPQPPGGPMGQLGRSPHMSTINRAAMLPPNGPQPPQGPGPAGSAHPTPSPAYQPMGRPPSSHDNSHHPMNPHPSPAMGGGRIPPGQERQHMDGPQSALDAELASYPAELIGEAKFRAGLGDRDAHSLSTEEKQNIIHHATRLKQSLPQNSSIAGPSGPHMHGQLQNRGPMAQPMQQQISMQQQRVAKRSSTSPGEEHQTLPRNEQSPPDRKRPRRTPIPAEQQQQPPQPQQPQQSQQQQQQSQSQPPPAPQQSQQAPQPPPQQPQQPPMAPMSQLPSGPQTMPGAGSMRMPGGQPHPNGFGVPPMHPMGMGHGPMGPMHSMSPGMVTGPPLGMMAQSQMLYQGQYRPGMVPPPKGNPNMPGPPVGLGDPQAQAHMRGGGQVPNRLSSQLVQPGQPPKPMGGSMLPPGQPGMNGPPKPGGKEGEGELNPAGSTPTPAPPHLNSGPPMNPSRPSTASAPLPTPAPPPPPPVPGSISDLPFDMAEMFGNHGGDFDFGTDPLTEMNLWLDQTAHDGTSLDMK